MTDHTGTGGNNTNVNTWFWIIAIVALLWNLMGLMAFTFSAIGGEAATEMMTEAQKEEYQNTPLWVMIAFGVATIGGTLGCIALLMRKKWATMIFIISLIGILIQFFGGVIGSVNVVENGASALIVPILVIVVGILLWYYSRMCEARGWLS